MDGWCNSTRRHIIYLVIILTTSHLLRRYHNVRSVHTRYIKGIALRTPLLKNKCHIHHKTILIFFNKCLYNLNLKLAHQDFWYRSKYHYLYVTHFLDNVDLV